MAGRVETAVSSQLATFQQPHNNTAAAKTLTAQDQISPLDVAFEINDGRLLPAVAAPDSPYHLGLCLFWDMVPEEARLGGEGLGGGKGGATSSPRQ